MNDYLQGEYEDAHDFWQQLEEAWFSHKGKGKGKRKGKKGKGKDKGDGKQDANYANQQQPRSLPAPSRSSQASGSHQGFYAHCVTTAAEVNDSEVNLLSGMMTSCQDETDCKVNNGEMIFDGMSAPVRYSLSKEMLTSAPDGFALMSAEEEVKETQAISFLTENRFPPTIAILDIASRQLLQSWTLDALELWDQGVQSIIFATMSTVTQIVDYGTPLRLPRASFTLPILRRLLALRNW